jgi:hypothetical protein
VQGKFESRFKYRDESNVNARGVASATPASQKRSESEFSADSEHSDR